MWIMDAGKVDGTGGEGAHCQHKGRRYVQHPDPRVRERGCPPFVARLLRACCKGRPRFPWSAHGGTHGGRGRPRAHSLWSHTPLSSRLRVGAGHAPFGLYLAKELLAKGHTVTILNDGDGDKLASKVRAA